MTIERFDWDGTHLLPSTEV